jgi:hypothetical protein
MMSPWISQDAARSRTDDFRRTAEARRRVSDASTDRARRAVNRRLGQLLIRFGQRLAGGDSEAVRPTPGYTHLARADNLRI